MNLPDFGVRFREQIGRSPLRLEAEFSFPFPFLATPREVRALLTSFEVDDATYGLLVIQDVSHERSVALMRATLSEMIVHDIKSPLTVLTANLGYLESYVRDAEDGREAIADGLVASKRIQSMLTGLIDTSRLETNVFPLARATVDLHDLASRAVQLAQAVARSRHVDLVLQPRTGPVVADVDVDLVLRVFENLLDNGMRHARRVTARVYLEGSDAVIEVRDDGQGIPAALRRSIFEKYAQVNPGVPTSRASNRGLGLTFVQLAARAHGGDASVDCPPEGGSVFRVTLPITPSASAQK
jgi:signal transduction histidine kinase